TLTVVLDTNAYGTPKLSQPWSARPPGRSVGLARTRKMRPFYMRTGSLTTRLPACCPRGRRTLLGRAHRAANTLGRSALGSRRGRRRRWPAAAHSHTSKPSFGPTSTFGGDPPPQSAEPHASQLSARTSTLKRLLLPQLTSRLAPGHYGEFRASTSRGGGQLAAFLGNYFRPA